MFELIILSFLNLILFKEAIFRPQIIAIIFCLFSAVFKIVSLILIFFDNDNENYQGNLPIYYKKNKGLRISFGILIYILLISLRSFSNLHLKNYMTQKNISQNKLFIVFGIIGTILYSIICIISNFFTCKEIEDNNKNKNEFFNYICKVEEKVNIIKDNNVTNITKYYLDNFPIYIEDFNNNKISNIVVIFLNIISFFFRQYFSIKIVKNLSPIHFIFSIPIIFLFQKTIMIIFTKIHYGDFFTTINRIKIAKYFLDISGDCFSIFGFLIYLEILEIKFFKFSYNIRPPNIRNESLDEGENNLIVRESRRSQENELS